MSDWPETSASLILRIRDPQDSLAWSQFTEIYQPVIYRLARRRGLQHSDAEDLCQQVLMAVAGAVERWEPSENGPRFRNWLNRVARNAILNSLTRRKADRGAGSSSLLELLQEFPEDRGMTSLLAHEGRMEAFRWAARQVQTEFNESTWTMFHETTVVGRTARDVAQTLDCSTGAVYIARCRVMQRIKQKIDSVSDFWSID